MQNLENACLYNIDLVITVFSSSINNTNYRDFVLKFFTINNFTKYLVSIFEHQHKYTTGNQLTVSLNYDMILIYTFKIFYDRRIKKFK
jgi:hypothetical protein